MPAALCPFIYARMYKGHYHTYGECPRRKATPFNLSMPTLPPLWRRTCFLLPLPKVRLVWRQALPQLPLRGMRLSIGHSFIQLQIRFRGREWVVPLCGSVPRSLAATTVTPLAVFLPNEKAAERFFGFFTATPVFGLVRG